jgi:hypothetical protein
MTFALKKIILYSQSGEARELVFNMTGLNIITGASKTGKSSIIDIIDYCTGRGECNVAEGVIRRNVVWFGILVVKGAEELFIGRRNPGPGTRTSGEIFFRAGTNISTPPLSELRANITRDSLRSLLTRFSGISENEHRPPLRY